MSEDKQKYDNEWNINPADVGYNKQHDSYYDKRDGHWLDKRCGDPECGFCAHRPLRAKVPT